MLADTRKPGYLSEDLLFFSSWFRHVLTVTGSTDHGLGTEKPNQLHPLLCKYLEVQIRVSTPRPKSLGEICQTLLMMGSLRSDSQPGSMFRSPRFMLPIPLWPRARSSRYISWSLWVQ
jgi:hypothetical protein